jgi:two-component system response regulator FixJ
MGGVQLLEEVRRRRIEVSTIVITGQTDISAAVKAIKAGAIDFIEKPFDHETLVLSIREAIESFDRKHGAFIETTEARDLLDTLTDREQAVLEKLVTGESNKIAAFQLGISPRTIEIHRSNILHKLHVRNVAGLVRVALAAERAEHNR